MLGSGDDNSIVGVDAPELGEAETVEIAKRFIEQLDSSWRAASGVNLYGRRLARVSKQFGVLGAHAFNYKVYLTPRMNAFSLPDGSVRVSGGMLDLLTDDELVFVLAEQIAYINTGVSKRRLEAAYYLSDIDNPDVLSAQQKVALETNFMKLSVSREEQKLAQEYAKRVLESNRIAPRVYDQVRKKLTALDVKSGYRVTYPYVSERIELPKSDVEQVAVDASESNTDVDAAREESLEPLVSLDPQDEEVGPEHAVGKNESEGGLKSATLHLSNAEDAIGRDDESEESENVLPEQRPAAVAAPVEKHAPPVVARSDVDGTSQAVVVEAPLPGWYLQIAAFTSLEEAEERFQRSVQHSLPVLLQRAEVGGVQYYRVLLGPYSAASVANAVRPQVESLRISKGQPFLKRVR